MLAALDFTYVETKQQQTTKKHNNIYSNSDESRAKSHIVTWTSITFMYKAVSDVLLKISSRSVTTDGSRVKMLCNDYILIIIEIFKKKCLFY